MSIKKKFYYSSVVYRVKIKGTNPCFSYNDNSFGNGVTYIPSHNITDSEGYINLATIGDPTACNISIEGDNVTNLILPDTVVNLQSFYIHDENNANVDIRYYGTSTSFLNAINGTVITTDSYTTNHSVRVLCYGDGVGMALDSQTNSWYVITNV